MRNALIVNGDLTHFDRDGNAVMVNVTEKAITHRRAEAQCRVMNIVNGRGLLSDPANSELLWSARVAGLQAAKQTSGLIPLCHPLPLSAGSISFAVRDGVVEISAVIETDAQTGVEMEALMGCAGAALSIVEALRMLDPQIMIDGLSLVEKSGGRSGHWLREQAKRGT